MLKIFQWSCPAGCGEFEAITEGSELASCPECSLADCNKIITAPAIHTLESHFRGMRGDSADEQFVPGHGGYRDLNLCDKKTGEPLVYNSLKEKRELLKKNGLFEKGPAKDPQHIRRSKRRMLFTREGKKTSQLGVN